MKYVLLIYVPADPSPDPDMLVKHRVFAENVGRRGLLVDGAELSDPSVTTTIRMSGTEMLITDGPYTETKEHLGGFYIVECRDLDQAIEVARLVPVARDGAVEVRPLLER
jgi:hypothetical protein